MFGLVPASCSVAAPSELAPRTISVPSTRTIEEHDLLAIDQAVLP